MFGLAVFQCDVIATLWARQQDPVYLYDFNCRGLALGASEDNSRGQNAAHRVVDAVDEGQLAQRGDCYFSVLSPASPASFRPLPNHPDPLLAVPSTPHSGKSTSWTFWHVIHIQSLL